MENKRNDSHAYIVANGEIIACIYTSLKNGTVVEYSDSRTLENINANKKYNLVNARSGKISRSKKFERREQPFDPLADEINPKEFFINES